MTTKRLHILSGGAAQGLLARVAPAFEARHGCRIEGSFGAVGLMREKLVGGDLCDVAILSDTLVRQLAGEGRLDAATLRPVGIVRTGLAVKRGAPDPEVHSAAALKSCLEQAGSVYCPDTVKSTAGAHFFQVLQGLGVVETLGARLRTFPNGTTAMAALAQAPEANAVGCTQATEILITPGVRLAGLLPAPYELATTYTAAVAAGTREAQLARELIAALTSVDAMDARRACGFE